jgi:low affinity Fe/Cu permease
MNKAFMHLATSVSRVLGSSYAFLTAVSIVLLWALSGPFFSYGETWQLVINTSTTIVTFLMMFLVQHTQNRDTAALNLKLDELIVAIDAARNEMVDLSEKSEDELAEIEDEFKAQSKKETPSGEVGDG